MMDAQIRELIVAYAVSAAAMLAGLLIMRAQRRAYWRWPVYSVMAMVLGVVSWNLLRKHALPPEWMVTRAHAMYAGALCVYAAVGIGMGLLLGRLTRRPADAPAPGSGPIP
jgi:hypothetical protein